MNMFVIFSFYLEWTSLLQITISGVSIVLFSGFKKSFYLFKAPTMTQSHFNKIKNGNLLDYDYLAIYSNLYIIANHIWKWNVCGNMWICLPTSTIVTFIGSINLCLENKPFNITYLSRHLEEYNVALLKLLEICILWVLFVVILYNIFIWLDIWRSIMLL